MEICIVPYRYWPEIGGVEKYVHRLCGAFRELGHHVTVVTPAHRLGLPEHEIYEGIEVYRYAGYRSAIRAWWELLKLRPVFASADVVHVSDTCMLEQYWRSVGWTLQRKPLFLTRHGMSYVCPVPEQEKKRAIRGQRMVDGIVHDGCFIEPWLGVDADCVPNQGLYPEAKDFPYVPEPLPNSAAFVGRLEPDSGIALYINSVKCLQEQYGISLTLNVYGDGTMRSELEANVKRDGLAVFFHGWQADAQERVADNCFAFVAGRMAMQEAMARRRLVVAAYVDPLKRDYVTGEPFSPHLVYGGNAKEIAEHVAYFVKNECQRRQKTEAAFEYANGLSWVKTAQAYLELWRRAPRRCQRQASPLRQMMLAMQLAIPMRTTAKLASS